MSTPVRTRAGSAARLLELIDQLIQSVDVDLAEAQAAVANPELVDITGLTSDEQLDQMRKVELWPARLDRLEASSFAVAIRVGPRAGAPMR